MAEKVGLVMEGGGMRGSYSIGAAAAMQEMGLHDQFDYVIGTSAGAMNAAYLLAQQADVATRVYCEPLSGDRFINYGRIRPMDIDYLVDIISRHPVYRLDRGALLNSESEFEIPVVHAQSGEVHYKKPTQENWRDLLHATVSAPVLYGRAIKVDSERYIDGTIGDQLPVGRAKQRGAGNIVVVSTQREFRPCYPRPVPYGLTSVIYYRAPFANAANLARARAARLNQAYDYIKDSTDVILIAPSRSEDLVSRVGRNAARIALSVEMGYEDAMAKREQLLVKLDKTRANE